MDADLGRGLIKQRIARKGQGRSAGFRTLLAFRAKARVVFVCGFAKIERDNIGPDELEFWKRVAGAFLALDERRIDELLGSSEIMEVARNGED